MADYIRTEAGGKILKEDESGAILREGSGGPTIAAATETDAAQEIKWAPKIKALIQATEIDVAENINIKELPWIRYGTSHAIEGGVMTATVEHNLNASESVVSNLMPNWQTKVDVISRGANSFAVTFDSESPSNAMLDVRLFYQG